MEIRTRSKKFILSRVSKIRSALCRFSGDLVSMEPTKDFFGDWLSRKCWLDSRKTNEGWWWFRWITFMSCRWSNLVPVRSIVIVDAMPITRFHHLCCCLLSYIFQWLSSPSFKVPSSSFLSSSNHSRFYCVYSTSRRFRSNTCSYHIVGCELHFLVVLAL